MIKKIETTAALEKLIRLLREQTDVLREYEFVYDVVDWLIELDTYGGDMLDSLHDKMEALGVECRAKCSPEQLKEIEEDGYALLRHARVPVYFECKRDHMSFGPRDHWFVDFVPATSVEGDMIQTIVDNINDDYDV